MALLEVEAVEVRYGGVTAVRGAGLSVDEGEVVGVLGPNGAGKSSLLAAIAGVVRPAAGDVSLAGRRLGRSPAERRARLGMALVAEGRGVLGPMTVTENLELGAYPSGRIGGAELRSRLESSFELFPILRERAQEPAGVLSGGEAAMLVVARALMSRPRVLLLDEPTLGLAPRATADVFAKLEQLKRQGTTMLVVEQKAADLLDLADRVAVMRNAEIVERARAGHVDLENLRRLYFGSGAQDSKPQEVT
jgi:branched-chain amino acid transport system ATP-binding protein